MGEGLRARLANVLATTTAGFVPAGFERINGRHGDGPDGHRYDGACALCRGEIDTLLDAMMPVIEERLWRARWTRQGKCTQCNALILAEWGRPLGREVEPHKMSCRFHVGPVEHRKLRTVYRDFWGDWELECTCGRHYKPDETCPDATETWRGPMPGHGDLA